MGAFVQGNLMNDEKVVAEAKIHWVYFLAPIALSLFLVGIPWLLLRILNSLTTEIVVTNKRFIAKYGIIRRNVVDQPLDKLDSLNFDQGIIERIFYAGSLAVATGGEKVRLPTIWRPRDFRNEVMQAQEAYKKSLYSGK
jgi:uncharacterized membrane protein YdbT with pleckstrin-like domain